MTPIRYELLIIDGVAYLRCYAPETLRGFINISAVRLVTGKSLDSTRKFGQKMAKRWRVPFVDKT